LLVAVSLFAVSPAFAADATKAARLIDLMHSQQNLQQMRDLVLANAKQNMLKDCMEHGTAKARCEDGVAQMLVPIQHALDDAFKWDEVKKEFVDAYAKALTDKEIDAAISYYG